MLHFENSHGIITREGGNNVRRRRDDRLFFTFDSSEKFDMEEGKISSFFNVSNFLSLFEEIKETLKESSFFRICDIIISYLLLLLL